MNNKHYLGRTVTGWEKYTETEGISGIALLKDDNTEVFAGDTSGYVLEAKCPYATQTMANNILAAMRGCRYKGYKASGASLGIDAELGDGVTVNGLYSVLARQTLTFGGGHTSEIAAPGEQSINHEFPYFSKENRTNRRVRAEMWSAIEKNAATITLEVGKITSELENYATIEMTDASIEFAVSESKIYADKKYTELKVTLDGVTVTDSSGTTKISGSSIETDTLYVKAANIEGDVVAGALKGDKINIASSTGTIYGEMSVTSSGALYILSGVASGFLLGGTDANPVVTCLGTFYAENVVADNIQAYIDAFETRIYRLERLAGLA